MSMIAAYEEAQEKGAEARRALPHLRAFVQHVAGLPCDCGKVRQDRGAFTVVGRPCLSCAAKRALTAAGLPYVLPLREYAIVMEPRPEPGGRNGDEG